MHEHQQHGPPSRTAAQQAAPDRQAIEGAVDALLEQHRSRAQSYGPTFSRLWTDASHAIRGGSLLRPQLLIDSFRTLSTARASAQTLESALRLGAAVELLHFGFLLHDDVLDGDLIRRHAPNLNGQQLLHPTGRPVPPGTGSTPPASTSADDDLSLLRRRSWPTRDLHWARTCGLLMGDLILLIAHQAIAGEDLPHAARTHIQHLLSTAVMDTIAGELTDVGLSDGIIDPDLDTILRTSRLKTAAYSFQLPLQVGAVLAGAPASTISLLEPLGVHLGTAYQLQDDLRSVFCESSDHGKDPLSDIREGKETTIIAYARMTSAWSEIAELFGRADLTAAEGERMRRLLRECGAESSARSLYDQEIRSAAAVLDDSRAALPRAFSSSIHGVLRALQGAAA